MSTTGAYHIGVDVGGTFTDLAVVDAEGGTLLYKVLSTAAPADGLLEGLEAVSSRVGLSRYELLRRTSSLVYGTTVATNAILTRSGARTSLITNRGLRDALEMRGGTRERPFDNWCVRPPPLVPRRQRLGVSGRLDAHGRELSPIDSDDVRSALDALGDNVESVAVCLMHSHVDGKHERIVAEALRERRGPESFVTVSSELLPQVGFEARLHTAVVNSYVGPVMRRHLEDVAARLREAGLGDCWVIMQSNGGMVRPEAAIGRPVVTALSGPAAALVLAARVADVLPGRSCISIDMGGTSFDIAVVVDGAPGISFDGRVGDVSVAVPLLDIHTIGAGGGSIGWIDERGVLRMGPQSAGAHPGPVAYGLGGTQPTCTDANLVLGLLDPSSFRSGGIELDKGRAMSAIQRKIGDPLGMGVRDAAAGMYRVLVAEMAAGIREATVERGRDPRELPLVVGGGAGALHAAAVADELGITTVVIPHGAATMSALGMLLSEFVHDSVRAHSCELNDDSAVATLGTALLKVGDEACRALVAQGLDPGAIAVEHSADVRYAGQFNHVTVDLPAGSELTTEHARGAFHAEHERLFGYCLRDSMVEVLNVRARARILRPRANLHSREYVSPETSGSRSVNGSRRSPRRIHLPMEQEPRTVSVIDATAYAGRVPSLAGPALIELPSTTAFLPPGWELDDQPLIGVIMRRQKSP
jgi:N-methylhydantoinase A